MVRATGRVALRTLGKLGQLEAQMAAAGSLPGLGILSFWQRRQVDSPPSAVLQATAELGESAPPRIDGRPRALAAS